MPLDGATVRYLDKLSQAEERLRYPLNVDDLRALVEWISCDNGPGPRMESVEDVALGDGASPTVRLRILKPRNWVPAVVVYLPGPAWGLVAGSLDTSDTVCRKLAERTGCTFVVVEHRKAPEHPYPAAISDAWQALLWAENYRRTLPAPTPPLMLVGEGSGGGLAAVLARRVEAAGGPAIGLVVLISPLLDTDTKRGSYLVYGEDGLLNSRLSERLWEKYLPQRADRASPDAVPLRAGELAGHPSTVILAAEHDPLRDEGDEYSARLAASGIPVERQVFPGQIHGFFSMLALPMGERAYQAVIRHLRHYYMHTDTATGPDAMVRR